MSKTPALVCMSCRLICKEQRKGMLIHPTGYACSVIKRGLEVFTEIV